MSMMITPRSRLGLGYSLYVPGGPVAPGRYGSADSLTRWLAGELAPFQSNYKRITWWYKGEIIDADSIRDAVTAWEFERYTHRTRTPQPIYREARL